MAAHERLLEEIMASRTWLAAAVAAAASAVLAGSVAWAAIPGSDGIITGCRDLRTGVLRVIDAEVGEQCRRGEAQLTWNQTGPAGPAGPQGRTGAQGPAGVSGYEVVVEITVVPANTRQVLVTECPAGKVPVGGGWDVDGPADPATRFTADSPRPDFGGWHIEVVTAGSAENVYVYAVCIATS